MVVEGNRGVVVEGLNVQSAYKSGCTVTDKFFFDVARTNKMATKTKDALDTRPLPQIVCLWKAKNCLQFLPSIKQKPNIAQVFVYEQQQAGSSRANTCSRGGCAR